MSSHLIPPQPEPTGAARLEAIGMSKRFGSLVALDDVSITVPAGNFHALLGENGAGKSTLVKSLIGFYKADKGTVQIDNRERDINSPRDAAKLGIGMIFQHFTVVPSMSVEENLALAGKNLNAVIDWKAERQRLEKFMDTAPFPLSLKARVADLAAGEKQKLEILKALYAERRFLILDEPTSVLTPQEADEVLGRMHDLTRLNVLSIIIITHKFREVYGYCDEVTVLRKGRFTGHAKVSDVSQDELAAWMMGTNEEGKQEIEAPKLRPISAAPATTNDGAVRLAVKDLLHVTSDGKRAVDGLSFDVKAGEILGVAGVSGNGQRELVAALTGVLPIHGGSVTVDGIPYKPTRKAMRALNIRSLPEEPLHNACVGKLSVAENLALRNFDRPPLSRGPWLSRKNLLTQAKERIAAYKVKTNGPEASIDSLSGGNVQRAVLAREISDAPRLLIVANPCFGLDFQAAAEIHARLRAAREGGAAILLLSEDLDELLALSDRLIVLSRGKVALECALGHTPADVGAIGRAMAGAHTTQQEAA